MVAEVHRWNGDSYVFITNDSLVCEVLWWELQCLRSMECVLDELRRHIPSSLIW